MTQVYRKIGTYTRCAAIAAALAPICWLPAAAPGTFRSPRPTPAPDAPVQQLRGPLEELTREVRRAVAQAEKELTAIPAIDFDLQAVVDAIGRDPEALQTFVREQTAWAPYRGLLRGAVGVLMDGSGSSLDRAVLLRDLLTTAGHDARIRRGELRAEVAQAALPDALSRFDQVRRERATGRAELAPSTALGERLAEDAVSWGDAQATTLSSALGWGPDERDDPAALAAFRERAIAAVRDVAWVEIHAAGASRDLPIWPDSIDTDDIARLSLADPLDGERHTVELRVVAERTASDGTVEEGLALQRRVAAADLVEGSIDLLFQPLTQRVRSEGLQKDEEALLALARNEIEWVPTLTIGDEVFHERGIRTDGTLDEDPKFDVVSQKLGGAIGALGGLAGPDTGARDGQCTAVWLEIVTASHDGPGRVVRRAVFDLVGPAARAAGKRVEVDEAAELRRGLAFSTQVRFAITVGDISAAWLRTRSLESLVQVHRHLLSALWAIDGGRLQAAVAATPKLRMPPLDLRSYDMLRRLYATDAHRGFLAEPNVVASHQLLDVDDQGLRESKAIDVIAHALEVVPDAGGPSMRRVRLAQGVLDTVVEHLVFRDDDPDNAAHLLHVSPGAGLEWRVAQDRGALAADGWAIDGASRARLIADLDAGWTVFAPTRSLEQSDHTFWAHWRIDPNTGDALGMGHRGFGQAATEEAAMLQMEVRSMIPVSRQIAARILCWLGMAMINLLIGLTLSAILASGIAATIATILLALSKLGDEYLGRAMLQRCIGNISPV